MKEIEMPTLMEKVKIECKLINQISRASLLKSRHLLMMRLSRGRVKKPKQEDVIVLDVGCSVGTFSIECAKTGFRFQKIGIEKLCQSPFSLRIGSNGRATGSTKPLFYSHLQNRDRMNIDLSKLSDDMQPYKETCIVVKYYNYLIGNDFFINQRGENIL